MTERDWLQEAAGALRDEASGDPPAGVDTRARVLASLQREQRSRRRWVAAAVPLAAVFLFSSAWAASTGRLGPTLARLVGAASEPTVTATPTPPPRAPALRASTAAPAVPSSPEPAAPAAPIEQATATEPAAAAPHATATPPGQPAATAEPRGAAQASAPSTGQAAAGAPQAPGGGAPAGGPQPSASAAREDSEEDRLYREAHQAHFAERNPPKALRAWDAYLRVQKSGRFATEAAYNRALTLVRLGRAAEARKALEPFAQGRFGSYRQAEAQRLIDAL